MKRILITGGAGFIGSHLCKRLLNGGNEVICLDNFFTGSKNNIIPFWGNPRFELTRHDIVEPIFLEVDLIYNLACPASPVHYQYNPVKTIKTNILGTLNMLGLAKRVGARILQASTSEVYGDPLSHPQREDYWGNTNPIGIRSCYDEGKRCSESLMFAYYRQNRVDIKVIRIFNTYGPNMLENDGRVVSNLIVQALKGETLTIYGDGTQTRSFCYIDDMIDGIIGMMNYKEKMGGLLKDSNTKECRCIEDSLSGFPGPVNLGSPVETTVNELAKLVLNLTGSKSKIIYQALPQDDPYRRKPDITLAKEKLGWEPLVSLEKGLEQTISYFEEKLRNQKAYIP